MHVPIRTGTSEIVSSDTLKIVGFTFGRRPGAKDHVISLRRKYAKHALVIHNIS